MPGTSPRAIRLALSAALVGALALAPAASAADPSRTTTCTTSSQSFSQVFDRAPWYDPANYTLLAGGDVEGDLPDWTLSGATGPVVGNETFSVGSADDTRSLALSGTSSVTSAPICVGLEYPTMRFFLRNSGAPTGRLKVEIRTVTPLGLVTTLLPTTLTGSGDWQLSPPILLVANIGALLSRGGVTPISIRFTANGGAWLLDDVYVDPYRSR
jgi:hypothetical protein